MLQQLRSGLGDHDMVVPLQGVFGDGEMSRVGGEDCRRDIECSATHIEMEDGKIQGLTDNDGALGELLDGSLVSLGIPLVALGVSRETVTP